MGVSSRGRGFGSTFFFELPLYGSNGTKPVQSKPRLRSGTRTPRFPSNRVLSGPTLSQNSSSHRPSDLPSIQYGFHIPYTVRSEFNRFPIRCVCEGNFSTKDPVAVETDAHDVVRMEQSDDMEHAAPPPLIRLLVVVRYYLFFVTLF